VSRQSPAAVAPRTRDIMLREAARLFAERGYVGVPVTDIGNACGISGPAVYKHFASKYELLARLLVDISEQLFEGGNAVVAAKDDPAATLVGLVEFHPDFALAEPDVIRVQDRDLESLEADDLRHVRRLQRRYVELWVDVLRRLQPELPADVARTRAHAVFGLLNSTPHSARTVADPRAELIAMALRALGHDATCQNVNGL
jgi:AcrR family transcriptional regulator